MAEERKVNVMLERVDSTTALRNVAGMANGVLVIFERSVLYPYIQYTARCSVPTMIGRKNLSIDCLVDSINGLGATTDRLSTEQVTPGETVCLQSDVSNDEAQRIAFRTVTHRLGKKLRMIAPFDVQLEYRGTVYRRFWVMRVGDGRIMADSVTGNVHPLTASAA